MATATGAAARRRRRWLAAVFVTGALTLFSAAAPRPKGVAPAGQEYTPPTWPTAPAGGGLLARLALITAVSVGAAGLALWWARKNTRVPVTPGAEPATVEVLGSVPLGSGCTLHLLRSEGACFVVGTDRTGLKAIHHVSDPFEQVLQQQGLAEPGGAADHRRPSVDQGG